MIKMTVTLPINCNKSVLQILHLCHRKKRKSTVNGNVLHWLKAQLAKIATTTIRLQKMVYKRENLREESSSACIHKSKNEQEIIKRAQSFVSFCHKKKERKNCGVVVQWLVTFMYFSFMKSVHLFFTLLPHPHFFLLELEFSLSHTHNSSIPLLCLY